MNINNFNINDFNPDIYMVHVIYYEYDEEDDEEYIGVKNYQEAVHFLKWNYEQLKKQAAEEMKRLYRPVDIPRDINMPLECVLYNDFETAYIYDNVSDVYMYRIEIIKLHNTQEYFKKGYTPI